MLPEGLSVGSLTLESPAQKTAAVVPNNDADLPVWARALWVGVLGSVRLMGWRDEAPQDFHNVQGLLPISVRRVYAEGTTATGIVALV